MTGFVAVKTGTPLYIEAKKIYTSMATNSSFKDWGLKGLS